MTNREQFNKFFQSKEHKEAIGLLERKCLYCENLTNENPHFESYCCKRGMCEDCFNAGIGTMEQYQIDGGEEEYSDQVAEAEKHGYSYLCYDHMKKNTELAN